MTKRSRSVPVQPALPPPILPVIDLTQEKDDEAEQVSKKDSHDVKGEPQPTKKARQRRTVSDTRKGTVPLPRSELVRLPMRVLQSPYERGSGLTQIDEEEMGPQQDVGLKATGKPKAQPRKKKSMSEIKGHLAKIGALNPSEQLQLPISLQKAPITKKRGSGKPVLAFNDLKDDPYLLSLMNK